MNEKMMEEKGLMMGKAEGAPAEQPAEAQAADQSGNEAPPSHPLQKAYVQTLTAGLKVLYSDETYPQVMQALTSGPDPAESMATLVSGIVLEMQKMAGGKMPQEVIRPTAMALLAFSAELANKAGIPVDENILTAATQKLMEKLGGSQKPGQAEMPQGGMMSAQPQQPPMGAQ